MPRTYLQPTVAGAGSDETKFRLTHEPESSPRTQLSCLFRPLPRCFMSRRAATHPGQTRGFLQCALSGGFNLVGSSKPLRADGAVPDGNLK